MGVFSFCVQRQIAALIVASLLDLIALGPQVRCACMQRLPSEADRTTTTTTFRTNVTTVCSPRPAYASSSVACSEMPVLQQLPQYVGAARQVVRHSSTPSSPR